MGSPRGPALLPALPGADLGSHKKYMLALGKIPQGSVEGHCPLSSSFPPSLLKISKAGEKKKQTTPNLRETGAHWERKMGTNSRKRSYF